MSVVGCDVVGVFGCLCVFCVGQRLLCVCIWEEIPYHSLGPYSGTQCLK